MTALDFLIAALATWRLSSLIVNEAGPVHVFQRIRAAAGIQHDQDGKATIIPDTFAAELLSCVWCASLWIGAGVAALLFAFPLAVWLLAPFALSAAAIIIEGHHGKV